MVDGLKHAILGPMGVSNAAKPLDLLQPVSRGAFLEVFYSAFIVLGTTGLAFAIYPISIYTISQQCKLGMSSLSEGFLAFLYQFLQSGINPGRLRRDHSFSLT